MSDDRTVVVREGGRDRFYYSRWGGSNVEVLLLRGPSALLSYLGSQDTVDAPFLGTWLCGLAFIDVDSRVLRAWSSQSIARNLPAQRLVAAMLSRAWPGWDAALLHQPATQVAALLPGRVRRALEPPEPVEVPTFASDQEGPWEDACRDKDWSPDIAAYGEAAVRRWFELDSHCSVVFIDDGAGVHETTMSDGWDCRDLLRAGPGALGVLRRRPVLRAEDSMLLHHIESAYWIDVPQRQVAHWVGQPRWPRPVAPAFPALWPGWSLRWEPGGVAEMVARCGRDPAALWTPEVPAALMESLRHRISRRGADSALAWVEGFAEAWLAQGTATPSR